MPIPCRVRCISDQSSQTDHIGRELLRVAPSFPAHELSYHSLAATAPAIAYGIAQQRMLEKEDWMQFEALVLDLNWSSQPPAIGEFAGLTHLLDPLSTFFRGGLPWKRVYLATIWYASNSAPQRETLLKMAATRGIPEKRIFGAAGPVAGPYQALARAIFSECT